MLGGIPDNMAAKTHLTGNPVRPMVIEAARTAFPDYSDGKLRILVTGGSQGARIFRTSCPPRSNLCLRLHGKSSKSRSRRAPRTRKGCAKPTNTLASMPKSSLLCRSADADRTGPSRHLPCRRLDVSELAVIGRPAILVPLPGAIDQDQAANAEQFAATGAAIVVAQGVFRAMAGDFSSGSAGRYRSLARRAAAAKQTGITDAAERLAGLVQGLVANKDRIHEVAG